jgi:hypothetical protein
MTKDPRGQKRSACPAGCQAEDPLQTVFPVNQLAYAGAVGGWLRSDQRDRSGDGMTACTQDGRRFMPNAADLS